MKMSEIVAELQEIINEIYPNLRMDVYGHLGEAGHCYAQVDELVAVIIRACVYCAVVDARAVTRDHYAGKTSHCQA